MTTSPVIVERDRLRRRNTAISLAFAAVACIVAIVLAVNSLTNIGGGGEDPFGEVGSAPGAGPAPTSAPTGTEPPPSEPAEPAPFTHFSSPSGNIGCVISTQVARCDIAQRDWDPGVPPASCTKHWGDGLVVALKGASITCGGTSAVGAETVLEYGRSFSEGNFTCTSSEAGMRCENRSTGRGFSLSRKTYTFF